MEFQWTKSNIKKIKTKNNCVIKLLHIKSPKNYFALKISQLI